MFCVHSLRRTLRLSLLAGFFASCLSAQSTFSTLLGTVKDPAGAAVPSSKVSAKNKGTGATRAALTDNEGNYSLLNLEPGSYELTVESPSFRRWILADATLLARQTLRVDTQLELASTTETVNVVEQAVAVINTDTSNIQLTKTGRELVDLPQTIAARATGSTSPLATLTAQPGVQTDPNGSISIVGGQPNMVSVTVDGVSTASVLNAGPLAELFPSINGIAEIKINQANNSAEYAGVADITTISRSGTNSFHGSGIWNLQNSALDARNPFSDTKPAKKMNDFGFSLGGPLMIPKLYNGKDRTFFFVTYEGLRLPRQVLAVESVPSLAWRKGDLSSLLAKGTVIYDPFGKGPFPNNQIPVNPVSAQILNKLFPLPNQTSSDPNAFNYAQLFPQPIGSNQFDTRLDQTISSRQSVFGRFTWKSRDVVTQPTGSALLGPFSLPEKVWTATFAHNFILSSTLINEIRGGFTGRDFSRTYGVDSSIMKDIAITGLPAYPPAGAATAPNIRIAGFQPSAGSAGVDQRDRTYQFLDNFTWIKNKHTFKFGMDYRRLGGYINNVFLSRRLGRYQFDGSVTNLGRDGNPSSATNPPLVGNPFAAFLLGVPDVTSYSHVLKDDFDGFANHWAVYGQDDFRVNSHLTLNFGLRWEYHAMFTDKLVNVTNFIPDYVSIVNGQTIRGAVVVPNEASLKLVEPAFKASIGDTPILTAAQAGLPFGMRYTQKDSLAPRFGFAYRPFNDNKTVIRGGIGRYIVTLLGGLIIAQWGVHASTVGLFPQSLDTKGNPVLTFPSPFPSTISSLIGTQDFLQAQKIDFKDPYVWQWNFTIERELARNTGVRLTYNGSKGSQLPTTVDYNQIPANTTGYSKLFPSRPYPLWGKIQTIDQGAISRFHSGTIEFNRRMVAGLTIQSSYTLSKNLSNANGAAPTSFAGENGAFMSDRFNLGADMGDVAYTRRQRFLTTFLYELPFGKGKTLAKSAVANKVFGGWETSGIFLWQTGPLLTATASGADPAGTGFPILCGCDGRADTVAGKTGNLSSGRTTDHWFDTSAFVVPPNNIGRAGDAAVGSLIGPGTSSLSFAVQKKVYFTERAGLQFGTQIANLFNHTNLDVPNTLFNSGQFGKITNVQTAEGAAPRVIQFGLRLFF